MLHTCVSQQLAGAAREEAHNRRVRCAAVRPRWQTGEMAAAVTVLQTPGAAERREHKANAK